MVVPGHQSDGLQATLYRKIPLIFWSNKWIKKVQPEEGVPGLNFVPASVQSLRSAAASRPPPANMCQVSPVRWSFWPDAVVNTRLGPGPGPALTCNITSCTTHRKSVWPELPSRRPTIWLIESQPKLELSLQQINWWTGPFPGRAN